MALSLILSLSSFLEAGNWARISSDNKKQGQMEENTHLKVKHTHTHTHSQTCDVKLGGVELL